MQGLCGNFNDDVKDDSMTLNGEINANITQFVQEWKTAAHCYDDPPTGTRGACSQSSQYEAYAKASCQKLKSGESTTVIYLLSKRKTKNGNMELST